MFQYLDRPKLGVPLSRLRSARPARAQTVCERGVTARQLPSARVSVVLHFLPVGRPSVLSPDTVDA